jgi:hypothetical protein
LGEKYLRLVFASFCLACKIILADEIVFSDCFGGMTFPLQGRSVFAYPDISFQLYGKLLARTTGALVLLPTEPFKYPAIFLQRQEAAYTPSIFWMRDVI